VSRILPIPMSCLLLCLLVACSEGPDGPVAGPAAWSLGAMPRVSIGLVDGEAAYVLSGIRDVRLLPDGQVVVADGGSQTVRIYSDEGRFQDQMGGRGEGPGEFTYL
jgi:hypothetical protein